MKIKWEEKLTCATACSDCARKLGPHDQRILSSYTHDPICLACKKQEEQKPDYAEVSQKMIGACLLETELLYGDLGSYCYHHFYPFKC